MGRELMSGAWRRENDVDVGILVSNRNQVNRISRVQSTILLLETTKWVYKMQVDFVFLSE